MTTLSDDCVEELILLLKEKPRATRRANREYIDTSNNLQLVRLKRHSVIFGRRGSGKTMLLSELAASAEKESAGLIWVDIDDYKTLTFPDILVQILRSIFAELRKKVLKQNPFYRPVRRFHARKVFKRLEKEENFLSDLLQRFEQADASREQQSGQKKSLSRESEFGVNQKAVSIDIADNRSAEETSTSKEIVSGKDKKIDRVNRHLHDAKVLLSEVCSNCRITLYIILDDFYHLSVDDQSLVLDFLQSLTKNLDVYIKFGTIAHRSRLYRKDGQIISGMQKEHDVLSIDLDRTFQNYSEVEKFIKELWKQILKKGELASLDSLFGGNSWNQLVLASGGTPRDFMNILAKALDIGRSRGKDKLDVLLVNEAANLYLRDTKQEDLTSDGKRESGELENMLMDIREFCVTEKKRNLFLIDKDDLENNAAQHELLRQLIDYRFVHLVHGNTSASSQRGRFEAYMLDVGLYSHPQRRGNNKVQQVDFLHRDEQRRADAVRTQAVYRIKESYRNRIGDPFSPPEHIDDNLEETGVDDDKSTDKDEGSGEQLLLGF
jgi:hypothetical protein